MTIQELQQLIISNIYENTSGDISGSVLQNIILQISNKLSDGLYFGGIVSDESSLTPDTNSFYICLNDGTYQSFGDVVVESSPKVQYLIYDNILENWNVEEFPIPTFDFVNIAESCLFGGVVTPNEEPIHGNDHRYFYLAFKEGRYTNFNNYYVDSNVCLFYWREGLSNWAMLALWPNTESLDELFSLKAYKPSSSTNGHLAGLTSEGDLTDSGIAADDVATQQDLATKQDTIQDLAAIRSGAAAGATALQQSDITPIESAISIIESVIPAQASEQNQLADKNFVNSQLTTASANFVGTFETLAELQAVQNPTKNDYGFVIETDALGNQYYDRYKYNGTVWLFEYKVESTSFTSEQWAAIQSGITSGLVQKINDVIPSSASSSNQLATMEDIPSDISELTDGKLYGGIINTQSTVQPDTSCYYIAEEGGNYSAFGVTVNANERVQIIIHNGTVWEVVSLNSYNYSYAHGKFDKVDDIDSLLTDIVPSSASSSNQLLTERERHFKGWYDSSSNLPANPVIGNYAYVKGGTASDPATIYECATAGQWSNSGRFVDTSNVQTFASGEEVNEVHIINDLTTGGTEDVLSAEQGKVIGDVIIGKESETKTFQIENVSGTGKATLNNPFELGVKILPGEYFTINIDSVDNISAITVYLKNINNNTCICSTTPNGSTSAFQSISSTNKIHVYNRSESIIEKLSYYYNDAQSINSGTTNLILTTQEILPTLIIDDLKSQKVNKVLSANQGRILNEFINKNTFDFKDASYLNSSTGDFRITADKRYKADPNYYHIGNVLNILNTSTTNQFPVVCFYDKDKQYLGYKTVPNGASSNLYLTETDFPEGTVYARFAYYAWTGITNDVCIGYNIKVYDSLNSRIESNTTRINGLESITETTKPVRFGCYQNTASLGVSDILSLTSNKVKVNSLLSANIDGVVESVDIGVGYTNNSTYDYRTYDAHWITLTPTQIKLYAYYNNGHVLQDTYTHGLTLTNKTFVKVVTKLIGNNQNTTTTLIVSTDNGQQWSQEISWGQGIAFVQNNNTSDDINVVLKFMPSDITKNVWMFGDSYFGRWVKYVYELGFSKWLNDSQAGASPEGAYIDLQNLLSLGYNPSFVVWCLGMNGNTAESVVDGQYVINTYQKTYIDNVRTLCESRNITPVFTAVPTVPTRQKTGFRAYIQSLGVRYIDLYNAVGADEYGIWHGKPTLRAWTNGNNTVYTQIMGDSHAFVAVNDKVFDSNGDYLNYQVSAIGDSNSSITINGVVYSRNSNSDITGLLSTDGVHPTAEGAKVIADCVMTEFPEISICE